MQHNYRNKISGKLNVGLIVEDITVIVIFVTLVYFVAQIGRYFL